MYKIICLLLITYTSNIYSQSFQLDTVYCDSKNTSYIVFKEDISFVDIGNPAEYAAQVKGNIVFIKPLKETASATTVLINTLNNTYYGTLMYSTKAKKYFYDLKGAAPASSAPATPLSVTSSSPSGNPPAVDPNIKQKLITFSRIGNEIKTLGIISSTIDLAVTAIRNDNNNTFLKLIVKNKSSIPFKLDFISFQYFQDMKKGAIRKSKKVPIDVFPLESPAITSIEPYKTESLLYVIPTYALANKGYLMVNLRESNGDRILKIKIKGITIQNSPQLIIN